MTDNSKLQAAIDGRFADRSRVVAAVSPTPPAES